MRVIVAAILSRVLVGVLSGFGWWRNDSGARCWGCLTVIRLILLIGIEARRELIGGFGGGWGVENDEFWLEADFALCSSVGECHNGSEVDIGIAFNFYDLEFGFGTGLYDDLFLGFFVRDGDKVAAIDGSDASEVVVFELIIRNDRTSLDGRSGEGAACPEFAVGLQRFFIWNICVDHAAEDQAKESDKKG